MSNVFSFDCIVSLFLLAFYFLFLALCVQSHSFQLFFLLEVDVFVVFLISYTIYMFLCSESWFCEFELLLNHNFCLPSVARSAWKVGLDAMQNFGSRSWNVQGSRQKSRGFFDTGGVKRQMSNKYFPDPHFVLKPELGKT